MSDPKRNQTASPYPSGSREEAAYLVGLAAEIPPPQIVMDEAMSAAWDRGMDDREKQWTPEERARVERPET